MKNKYLLIIYLFLVNGFNMFAQQAPIVEVTIAQPSAVCVEGGCVDLTADYFVTKPTTDYDVQSIIYQNIYSYTGGTVLNVTTDDVWSPTFDLPFSFNFYGQNFNKVLVGSNGVITFDIAGVVPGGVQTPGGGCAWSYNTSVPSAAFPIKNSIYGVYQDTNMNAPPIQDPLIQNVNYYVGGTAPNRYFVANFNRLPQYNCGGTLGATVDLDVGLQTSQIVIYETTNIIDVFVRKRSFCGSWNNANGVIGVQNQSGSLGETPPGRNAGGTIPDWNTTNEGWRFIPSGVGPDLVTLTWKDENGVVLGIGNPLNVCIEDADVPETFTAEVTYINGTVIATATDEIEISVAPPLPVLDPQNITLCTSDPAPYTFNLNQDIYILNGAPDYEYEIYYFLNETAANNLSTSQALSAAQIANFQVLDNQPVTIYVLIKEAFGNGCHNVRPFTIQGGTPSGTFSYPDDGGDPGFCMNSNPAMAPVLNNLTAGGSYLISPTTGLIIDAATGVLDLTNATPGTYTVNYKIPAVPGGCPEYNTYATVLIEGCFSTTAGNSGPICAETPTFDLTATTAGAGATYAWTGPSFVSTDQNPTGITTPTTPGDYIYTVVATINGADSAPSSTTLTVHPTPTASFVSTSTTICTNSTATLIFTGTPGSTVTINDGANDIPVLIDAAGNGQYTTGLLNSATTYSILKVVSNTTPACEFIPVPSPSITISVGLPTATMVGFADPVICSGTGTTFSIQGTPGGIVTYTIDTVPQATETIPAGGTKIVTVPTQNVAGVFTYELTNIVTPGSNGCSNPITGQSATLTVNALPTATFATSTPVVCEGTTGTITITGTPGASVVINDGNNDLPAVDLPAGGTYTMNTAALMNPTLTYTYTLVSASITSSGVTCSAPLTGSLTIDVDANPVITTQPVGTTVCIGDPITLSVVATGANLSYQWVHSVNGNVGSNSPDFTIASPTNADAGDYTVTVTGSCGTPVTSAIATIVVNQPTVITTQPVASTTVCVGQPISLSVTATGINLTYQWKKGPTVLPAQTNPTLNIASATVADAGTYTCDIINPCQTVTTINAVVIVNELPAITVQPVATTTICAGEPITLSVTATGTALTYQWYLGPNAIPAPAGTAATYTDASVTIAEAGNYTVTVSGYCTPAVTSNVATVVVNQGPTFTLQPVASTIVCEGEPVTLSVATTGGTNVTYQWKKGTADVTGATSSTLTIDPTVVGDTGSYTCVVSSDSCPDIISSVAAVTVNQAPDITLQPVSQTVCVNDTVTFTTQATPTGVTYQWYKGGDIIPNATSSTYTISPATEADNGDYTCVVSSTSCPDITSSVATLLVRPLPVATITNGSVSTICEGQSTEVIFEGTPGAVVIYTVNGQMEETITLNVGPTILPTGSLDETTVYELVSVTYTGANACSQLLTGSATVTVNPLPEVSLEDGYICIDPVTLAVTRTYRLDTGLSTGDYTFEWSDANGVIPNMTNSYYDASAVGQYGVKIMDIVTLCEQTAFANVYSSSPPVSFTYTVNGFFSQNPTVVITAQPAGDYEYQLDYGPFQESNVFDGISAGTHTITVRDPQACDVLTDEVTIIDYPKYFTPNGDGFHDTWNISEFGEELNAKIYIFDRFGKLVKEISTTGLGWDGTFNGQPLPATDYWFTLDYEENGVRKQFKSHFAMKR